MKNGKIECEECGADGSDLHRLGHCYVNSEGKLEVWELLSDCGWFCDVCGAEVTVREKTPKVGGIETYPANPNVFHAIHNPDGTLHAPYSRDEVLAIVEENARFWAGFNWSVVPLFKDRYSIDFLGKVFDSE